LLPSFPSVKKTALICDCLSLATRLPSRSLLSRRNQVKEDGEGWPLACHAVDLREGVSTLNLSTTSTPQLMWVVFLRAVNVGGTNRCQPALIAKQLAKFGVVNIGAVGTFVVRKNVSESALRAAIARKLPFKCEIMICPARDIIKLTSKDPFSRQPGGADITRFVNVLHKPVRTLPPLPLGLPSDDDWLVKIIAIQGRFVLGVYRRQMKAISCLGKIEKLLGVPLTNRNWNTIQKVAKILGQD
jgi:uncharacterized protein (DUF1697 family)